MHDRLPQVKPKELVRALERLGFDIRRPTGSHVILRDPIRKVTATIPMHSGDIKRGVLFAIIRQANISLENFINAL
jgi:predicted RNA binding protein YcfA (HicA-like mRNA interferase family)